MQSNGMYKYDENEKLESVNGALKLRKQIEEVVDEFQNDGFENIFFLGIGGTWASAMQVEVHMKKEATLMYM